MRLWLVGYKEIPLQYTRRNTAIVEAETAADAMALVQDALLRAGDGTRYIGLKPPENHLVDILPFRFGRGAL